MLERMHKICLLMLMFDHKRALSTAAITTKRNISKFPKTISYSGPMQQTSPVVFSKCVFFLIFILLATHSFLFDFLFNLFRFVLLTQKHLTSSPIYVFPSTLKSHLLPTLMHMNSIDRSTDKTHDQNTYFWAVQSGLHRKNFSSKCLALWGITPLNSLSRSLIWNVKS